MQRMSSSHAGGRILLILVSLALAVVFRSVNHAPLRPLKRIEKCFRKPSFDSACSGRSPAKISRNPPDTWNFKILAVKLTE